GRDRARPAHCASDRGRSRRTHRCGVGHREGNADSHPSPSRLMASILLVDDEESPRAVLALLLKQAGHDVAQADGGAAAAEALAASAFDLVITDLRMPGGDGLEVVRLTRATRADAEVIVLTAYAGWESTREAMRLGAFDYAEKGREPDELFHRIDQALERQARRRGNERPRAQGGHPPRGLGAGDPRPEKRGGEGA